MQAAQEVMFGGIGAVIRNDRGEVMAVATWKVLCGLDTRVVECVGVRLGLKLALDLCFQQIEAETDCLEVFQALRKQEDSPSYFHAIVKDCLLLGCFFFANFHT